MLAITSSTGTNDFSCGGGVLVWRGISLDLDEKINLREMTQNAVLRLERLAARFHIRLPTRNLLRRLANSE